MEKTYLLSRLQDIKKMLLKEVPLTRYLAVYGAELVVDENCPGIAFDGFKFYFNPNTYELTIDEIKENMKKEVDLVFDGIITNRLRSVGEVILYDDILGYKIPTLRDLLDDGERFYPYLKVEKKFENEEAMYLSLVWQSNVSSSSSRGATYEHGRGVFKDDIFFEKIKDGLKRINANNKKAEKINKEYKEYRFDFYKSKLSKEMLSELDSILVFGKLSGYKLKSYYRYSKSYKLHTLVWGLLDERRDFSIIFELSFNDKHEFTQAETRTLNGSNWNKNFSSNHYHPEQRIPKEQMINKFKEFVIEER